MTKFRLSKSWISSATFHLKRLLLQKGFHPHGELGDIWVSQPVKGDFADLQSIYLSLLPVIKFPRYFCWRGTLLQPIYFSSLLGLHLPWEVKEWKPFKNKWTHQIIIWIHYRFGRLKSEKQANVWLFASMTFWKYFPIASLDEFLVMSQTGHLASCHVMVVAS